MIRILFLTSFLVLAGSAFAQHPIEVERLKADGKYKEAYLKYQKLPRRTSSTASTLAAAHSAWAIGLPEEALKLFTKALSDESLLEEQKARAMLSRAIIHFQELRYHEASVLAQEFLEKLTVAGPLRSKGFVLWGDSLSELGQFGQAENKYQSALLDASDTDKVEIHFRLGKTNKSLGNLSEASAHLKRVPLGDERTAKALRLLGEIYAEQKDFSRSSFWLAKGRKYHAEEFLDSWVDYVLLKAAIERDSLEDVRAIEEAAEKRFPPSDDWNTLLRAEATRFKWLKQGGGYDRDAKARLQ